MAFQYPYSNTDEEKTLAHDLRQIYAIDILGNILKRLAVAMEESDFQAWWRLMKRDLRVVTNHKFTPEEREEIKKLINKTSIIISKYPDVFLKVSDDEVGYYEIDEALCELYMLFWILMEKHNMLGSTDYYDENEI